MLLISQENDYQQRNPSISNLCADDCRRLVVDHVRNEQLRNFNMASLSRCNNVRAKGGSCAKCIVLIFRCYERILARTEARCEQIQTNSTIVLALAIV